MAQCPYCSKEIKENDRFCLSCGRQLDGEVVEEIKSGGISDLKTCFGSFPMEKIDCYLCADEQKCSNYALSIMQRGILSKLDKIYNLQTNLSDMKDYLDSMKTYLRSIEGKIGSMNKDSKR